MVQAAMSKEKKHQENLLNHLTTRSDE
jgi:hypothetical protein